MSESIAIVDNDENLLTSLSMALQSQGFGVRTFTNSDHALTSLSQTTADLLVLDIKMPRMNGIELLGRLRGNISGYVPAIFLSAAAQEADQIAGLRVGAEDYVTKPFSQTILIEKIIALLRFAKKLEGGNEEKAVNRGELSLDPLRRSCSWKGEYIKLTRSEFEIIRSLSTRPGIVKSRDELLDTIGTCAIDRNIDSHIKRIRKKFKNVDDKFFNIKSEYSLGYYYQETRCV